MHIRVVESLLDEVIVISAKAITFLHGGRLHHSSLYPTPTTKSSIVSQSQPVEQFGYEHRLQHTDGVLAFSVVY